VLNISWDEYNDLFYLAQEKGKFHLFIFDIKESRNGYDNKKIQKLRGSIIERIQNIESDLKIKILHLPEEKVRGERTGILGDLFSVIIIKDTIEAKDIYRIFREEKSILNIPYEFHYDDAFYETDDWILGNTMYYREYCISFLESRSKIKTNTI
jgi:hypothetical protein